MPQFEEEVFDVRKLERALQEKSLTPAEVEAWLAGLEDCSANAETSHVQMIAHDRTRRALVSDEGGQEEDEG
jgi:hypothetical protein